MEGSLNFLQNKKVLIVGGVVVLVILAFMSTILSGKRNGSSQTGGSSENKALATVGDKTIYTDDVRQEAKKQLAENAIDDKALQSNLDKLTEREILDQAAKKYNIVITDEEIQSSLKNKLPNATAADFSPSLVETTKYSLLKRKITEKTVEIRTAYAIGFWIPPLTNAKDFPQEDQKLFDERREAGQRALTEVEARIVHGETPLNVVQAIYNNYPVLQPILSLNGYIFEKTSDKSVFSQPQIYFNQTDQSASEVKVLYKTMFTMQPNETKTIKLDDGAGGYVVKIVSTNHATYQTYEQWLADQRKNYVK